MRTYFTVVRYPKPLFWAGFLSMVTFRFFLLFKENISFYKLLGCGRNGSFSTTPDLYQFAILATTKEKAAAIESRSDLPRLYGKAITNWWRFFHCSVWTVVLQPVTAHGSWNGKMPFVSTSPNLTETNAAEMLAVLTRASIRPAKLLHFWRHVPTVAAQMMSSAGYITSFGIGELPWIRQATFSIWKDKHSMQTFAYAMQAHKKAIAQTHRLNWYSEDMYVRFQIVTSFGLLNGADPLQGKL